MKHMVMRCLMAACVMMSLSAQAQGSIQSPMPSMQAAGKPQSVGLVLSGGGAKGIAHIGVIQALEDNNIPIDFITGTSMGAIVGGLYAAGYTPKEMMELIQSRGFAYWSSGRIDEKLTYYFAQNEPTPALVHFNLGKRDSTESGTVLPSSLINPLPMNFAFMDLFAAYTAQCGGDFNKLFVPLRTVTSNIYAKHKMVLSHGSLGDAIRASMSFPLVFHPIEMDGVLVYDGGIYDNFPVNVMREDFAPDIMLGINVSGPDSKPKTNDILQQLEDMIIQNNDYSLPADEGIYIHVPVQQFSLLDWGKAREIYQIGYDRAMQMMDSIKVRVTSRIPKESRTLRRQVFKSQTPYVRFDSVTVSGGTHRQDEYVRYLFTRNRPDTFGIASARDAYYRAITSGKFENLTPKAVYDSGNGLFDLHLKADVKDNFRLGFGGYISSSTSSMIFLSAGYNTLSYNSFNTDINAWIGQSYLAGVYNARFNLLTPVPSSLRLQFVASRQRFYENDKIFFTDNLPTFITDTEIFGRLIFTMATGRRGKTDIGIGAGHLFDKYFENNHLDYSMSQRDRLVRNLAQIYLRYKYTTLNNQYYPTSGAAYGLTLMGVYGKYECTPYRPEVIAPEKVNRGWGQVEAYTRNFFDLGKRFSFGLETNLVASTRKLLTNYDASIVDATPFNPTPSSYNAFNPAFRANSYVTAGMVPVWKFSETVQLRGTFHGFMPFRKILENADHTARYGSWFSHPEFFGEGALVISLPFASVSAYGNYMTYPAHNWNFGLSFGVFLLAPRFLR